MQVGLQVSESRSLTFEKKGFPMRISFLCCSAVPCRALCRAVPSAVPCLVPCRAGLLKTPRRGACSRCDHWIACGWVASRERLWSALVVWDCRHSRR